MSISLLKELPLITSRAKKKKNISYVFNIVYKVVAHFPCIPVSSDVYHCVARLSTQWGRHEFIT